MVTQLPVGAQTSAKGYSDATFGAPTAAPRHIIVFLHCAAEPSQNDATAYDPIIMTVITEFHDGIHLLSSRAPKWTSQGVRVPLSIMVARIPSQA